MISFEQAIDDQKDLNSLCQDRPLRQAVEIFAPNDYYGHASILKDYMGVSCSERLYAVIQHGITLGESFIWDREIGCVLPKVYCWQKSREKVYERHGKIVISGAAPMLYAMKVMDFKLWEPRNGSIFFPAHSTHHIAAIYDRKILAKQLANLPEKYQPVNVCIYWRDYELGHGQPYIDQGLKIVSAGGMWDENFCYRWLHLVSMHRYAITNDIGSSLFYAVAAGLPVWYIGDVKPDYYADCDNENRLSKEDRPPELCEQIGHIFQDATDEISPEQAAFVAPFIGEGNLVTPEELRKALL